SPLGHADDTPITQVRATLKAKCIRCHGPQKQNAEVRLDRLSTDLEIECLQS
ncbi:MAG: hypothetical protein GY826_31555, partial [Fuerstiella sp.]|nr:hypothetical protein [Fuerstiella sp.]